MRHSPTEVIRFNTCYGGNSPTLKDDQNVDDFSFLTNQLPLKVIGSNSKDIKIIKGIPSESKKDRRLL